MVSQITKGIKITVLTDFEGTFFKNYKTHYIFSYHISIENNSSTSVQLFTRHWEIYDPLNHVEVIDGEGVIAKKPVIKSGEKHSYSSNCILYSPFGTMKGYFEMIDFTSTKDFKVIVPTFRFSANFALN